MEALAERGVDGEKLVALRKIARLRARYNFETSDSADMPDLFRGVFKRASKARKIYAFEPGEFDLANSVKWAIESATRIACLHSGQNLVAEAAPETAKRLSRIAEQITLALRVLIDRFNKVDGVSPADRGVFVMGLYDGMMNDPRGAGQALPKRPAKPQGKKRGRAPASGSGCAGLHVHPYTLAFDLGRQVRLSVPIEKIAHELEAATQARLPERAETAGVQDE